MTIASTLNRTSVDGNGVTTSIPVTFPFHAQADLIVISTVILTGVGTLKTITTHYTIAGTPDALGHYSAGGSVEFLVAPASTERITIYRDPEETQGLNLTENNSLPAESLEAQLDYLTMLIQRLRDLSGRSLSQPEGDSLDISTLPAKVTRASTYLAFDSDGDPMAAAAPVSVAPSAFIATLLDDADIATALATLGLTTGTWTPVLTAGTPGDLSVAYTARAGTYWKFASLVVAQFYVITSTWTHTTASGNLLITGLSAGSSAAASLSGWSGGGVSFQGITKASYTAITPYVVPGAGPTILFKISGSAQNMATLAVTDAPTTGVVWLNGFVVYQL